MIERTTRAMAQMQLRQMRHRVRALRRMGYHAKYRYARDWLKKNAVTLLESTK